MSTVPGPVLTDVHVDESESFLIGLREHTAPEAWSLIVMEAEDDQDLGMDSYALVTYPGQATTYGGVLECELRETSLRLRLTDSAALALGLPTDTTFPLDVSPEHMAMLRRGLRRVFTSGQTGQRPRHSGL